MASAILGLESFGDITTLFTGTKYTYDRVPADQITLYDIVKKSNEVLNAYKNSLSARRKVESLQLGRDLQEGAYESGGKTSLTKEQKKAIVDQ